MITLISGGEEFPSWGRPAKEGKAKSASERQKKVRSKKAMVRKRDIAILDFETDPFDKETELKVRPFLAVLYSDQFETVTIWDEDYDRFCKSVVRTIECLPGAFTIYAHNGGRFDYMFLVSQLRGTVSFKGRGLMSARIGNHDLRDSFNIIPEKLASYRKDEFDYSKMRRENRNKHRKEITEYAVADCRYLFELMRHFVDRYGMKLTIGQTAMGLLKQHYEVEKFTDNWDRVVREYFFGGRVQCIRGRGEFEGHYKLYDVNSMYPHVMASYDHPIGGMVDYRMRTGAIKDDTIFIDLTCDNAGALMRRTDEGEVIAPFEKQGRYLTTIWEFDIAIKWGLISNIIIHYCLDCPQRTNFSKFILPIYEKRQLLKAELRRLRDAGQEDSEAWHETKRDDMFHKYLMNTGYGKFAQNPRNFKEHFLCSPGECPPDKWMKSIERMPADERTKFLQPEFEHEQYWIWSKPNPGFRFNNVGTAASITGAARSVLLDALQMASDPIYCDTDSIICRNLDGVEIDKSKLGAWDLEDEFSRVAIAGKKLYGCQRKSYSCEKDRFKIRSKGSAAPSWPQMMQILSGEKVMMKNRAPTLDRFGRQEYLARTIQATAPILSEG